MKPLRNIIFALMGVFVLWIGITATYAQPVLPKNPVYFIAADANNVQQVYQYLLDGQSEPRQITQATRDIVNFGVAPDGLSVVYISAGQLWLQPLHTETPEALAALSATQFLTAPVFSQDRHYLAYADNGVWLIDLGSRETRQLIADVPLVENASNAGEYRQYMPERFVLNAEGKAAHLILDTGVWEWKSAAIYDLATGELTELQGQTHTDLLPLSDGRLLVYGNNGINGDFALHIAESLADINTMTALVNFADLTDQTLFVSQAVEIEPGVVRVFGEAMPTEENTVNFFTFDYDLNADTASEVTFLPQQIGTIGNTSAGTLSPDGAFIPMYTNALWTETGSIYGELILVDTTTGDRVEAAFTEVVGVFGWQ